MIFINVAEPYEGQIDPELLELTANTVLKSRYSDQNVDLTIVIDGDEQLHKLNLEFLRIDAPTDVLSFPAEETDPDSGNLYIGDIIISLPRAAAQALTAGHPTQAELQLLVIHGVLHLLGYDHSTIDEKTDMWKVQSGFIYQLAVPIKKLPEE